MGVFQFPTGDGPFRADGLTEMTVTAGGGGLEPSTKHSTNPVPCILFDPAYDGSYRLRQATDADDVQTTPGLSHLAATLFEVMGEAVPEDINPSLIEQPDK